MKKNKTPVAFIILVILLCVFLGITLYTNILSYKDDSSQTGVKVRGFVETLNRVAERVSSQREGLNERTERMMELMCSALRTSSDGSIADRPEIFDDGVVIQLRNGSLLYPENFPGKFQSLKGAADLDNLGIMTDDVLIDREGNSRPVKVSAKKIEGDLYYLGWWEMEDYLSFANYDKYIAEAVGALEELYNAKLVVLHESENGTEILYASQIFNDPYSIEDLGIVSGDITSESSVLRIGKKAYSAIYEDVQLAEKSAKAVILLNQISTNRFGLNSMIFSAGFIFISISLLICYLHWVEGWTAEHELTEKQKAIWHSSRLRRNSASFGINGAVILFVILTGYQLLGNISYISNSNQESLDIVMGQLKSSANQVSIWRNDEEKWGIYYAEHIADLCSAIPELRNHEFLKKANELIGSEFVILYDAGGNEIAGSNSYVNFTLGDGVTTDEDFKYLLNGIERIVHEPGISPISGQNRQLLGVSMQMDERDTYGAVILAIDPEITWESAEKAEIQNTINTVTHEKNLSLIVNRSTNKVIYSSDSTLLGKMPVEFGINSDALLPVSMESFEVADVKYFGAYDANEQFGSFFMTEADSVWGDSLKFAAFSSIFYVLTSHLIVLYLLGRSHISVSKEAVRIKEKLKQPKYSLEQDAWDTVLKNERGDRSLKDWWTDMTPEQKVFRLMNLIITLSLILVFLSLFYWDNNNNRSVIEFVMKGNWSRGFNELSVTAIFFVLISLLTFIMVKNLLTRLLAANLNSKGRTVIGLISSLLQYISIITAVFMCLSYLGFDTGALITSASILTLAVSLGSKDLIADILSGIFIIFEGDFQVGDTIEVNGFKGKVLEIGVRSTKLKDASQNIKIIDNQSVKNVLNLSKYTTKFSTSITLSASQSLDEIKTMLDHELPKIKERIPQIINGPNYYGITSIGYHRVEISIGAECNQGDLFAVKTLLNGYLYETFRNNGFQL